MHEKSQIITFKDSKEIAARFIKAFQNQLKWIRGYRKQQNIETVSTQYNSRSKKNIYPMIF